MADACGCQPESDLAFCARLGKTCGSVTATDNCGASRTAECGTCGSFRTCLPTNVCGNSCPTGEYPLGGACTHCDVRVPEQQATIAAAIAASPSPGTVCVAAGTYTENLSLRPHVSLVGEGPATRLKGIISVLGLADADPAATVVRGLSIDAYSVAFVTCPASVPYCNSGISEVLSSKSFALSVEHVDITGGGSGTTYCSDLSFRGGNINFSVHDSSCTGGRGFRITSQGMDAAVPDHIDFLVERTRFQDCFWCVDFGPSGIWGTTDYLTSAAGTKVNATIRNNEFVNTRYSVYTFQSYHLAAADKAGSRTAIVNNTFAGGLDALWNNTRNAGYEPTVVLANNLYWNLDRAVEPSPSVGPTVDVGNLSPAVSPFVDVAKGDLHLVSGSAPIDAASPSWAPADDKDGKARPVDGDHDGTSAPDVGAHEFYP